MKRVHRSAAQGTEYGELLADLGAGKIVGNCRGWELGGPQVHGMYLYCQCALVRIQSKDYGAQVRSKTACNSGLWSQR